MISVAFAQTSSAQAQQQSPFFTLILFGLMFVVLYFLMIRPQMKRQKEHKAMVEALVVGDEVVAAGGVIGKVAKLGDSVVHLEVSDNLTLQVQRASIAAVLPKGTYKA